MTYLLLILLAIPAALALLGWFGPFLSRDDVVQADPVKGAAGSSRLFVLIHGMAPTASCWDQVQAALWPHGQVLRLHYNAGNTSNADPNVVAAGLAQSIKAAVAQTGATRVVIVAHSMGALLARRAMLDAASERWVSSVERVVLMAGVSRGWTVSGDAPADANVLYRQYQRVGYWVAHMLRLSSLVFSFERGSPFVANLRLQWMNWVRSDQAPPIEVVQMLGDIDDVVSREDDEDLRVMASRRFVQLSVRGTGHGDIVEFGAGAKPGTDEAELGVYRRNKFLVAATEPFEKVRLLNEAQAYTTDPAITEVVFVLHGIRDLGRWSANFESAIDRIYPGRRAHLQIVSSRYGYFGMGPFLFEDVRNRYVRWFMDEYTETLARYPNLKPEGIRFFGHSNGTYILAEALRQYQAMEIERVVFAGSVVPKAYDWGALTVQDPAAVKPRPRVQAVRNYVGTEDWVVALFPRLFELPVASWLHNQIGSAGFNGFDDEQRVDNVRFVHGAHSAFESRVDEIVRFLLDAGSPAAAKKDERSAFGHVLSAWPTVLAVWALIIFVVLGLGTRVVGAAPSPGWPALLAYALLLTAVLRTV
jgi:pimeloyl-ACP methyl ester carboxylesterase